MYKKIKLDILDLINNVKISYLKKVKIVINEKIKYYDEK